MTDMTDQLPDQHDPAHGEHHGVGHVVDPKILIGTGLALLVLTVVTVVVAGFDFGDFNIWIALSIAGLKASLVTLFFMHLFWDRPFNSFVLVSSVAFLVIFIGFAITDSFEYSKDIEQWQQDVQSKDRSEITPSHEAPYVKTALGEANEALKKNSHASEAE